MDKIEQLYNLYLSKGLITEATTLEKFQSANTEQATKLYDLGKKNGLFEKTDQNTFLSAWQPVKKKEDSEPTAPSQELVSEQETGSLATAEQLPIATPEERLKAEAEFLAQPQQNIYPLVEQYKQATSINEDDIALAQQEAESKLSGTFGESLERGYKNFMNIVTRGATLGMRGRDTQVTTYADKKRDEAFQELMRSGVPLNEIPSQLDAKIKELAVNEETERIKERKQTDYLKSLPKEQKEALNIEQVNEIKSITNKEKSLLIEAQITGKEVENAVMDIETLDKSLKLTEDAILKMRDEGKEAPEDLINHYNEKLERRNAIVESIREHVQSINALESEYEKNQDKEVEAREAIDLIKREYGFLENMKGIVGIGIGDAVEGGLGALAFFSMYNPVPDPAASLRFTAKAREQAELTEKTKERFRKTMEYTDIDSWSDLGYFVAQETATQVPVMAQIMIPYVGISSLGATTGGRKFAEMQEGQLMGETDFNQFQMITAPIVEGSAEAVLGALPTFKIMQRTLGNTGRRKLFNEGFVGATKQFGKDLAIEVSTESLTEVVQNINDRYLLNDKSVSVLDNIDHVAAKTLASMPVFLLGGRAINEVRKTFMPKSDIETVKGNLLKIQQLREDAEQAESQSAKNKINESIQKLEQENETVFKKTDESIENIDKAKYDKIKEITKAQAQLQVDAKNIVDDAGLNPESKKRLIQDLKNQFESLENQRDAIVSGKAQLADLVSPEEVIRLKDQASRELIQEAGEQDVQLNDTQITERAVEIFNRENEQTQETTPVQDQETQLETPVQEEVAEVVPVEAEIPQTDAETQKANTETDGGVRPGIVQGTDTSQDTSVQPTPESATGQTETKITTKKAKNAQGVEYDVDINESGQVTEIRNSKTGKPLKKFTERTVKKTKQNPRGVTLVKNAKYAEVEAEATGTLTEGKAVQERNQILSKALDQSEVTNEYEAARDFFIKGGAVSLSSARTETGLTTNEVKWATKTDRGFVPDSQLPSLQAVAGDIVQGNDNVQLNESEVRTALINLIKDNTGKTDLENEIIAEHQQTIETQQQQEAWEVLNRMTEQERSIYESVTAEDAYLSELTEQEISEYYEDQYRQKAAPIDTKPDAQLVSDEKSEGRAETKRQVDLAKDLKIDDVKEWLDQVDKNLEQFGKETLGMNLPVAVARAAVSAMKLAAATAKTGADIVSAGINAVRESNWYKKLSAEQKKSVNENTFQSLIAESIREANRQVQKLEKQKQDVKNYLNDLKSDFEAFLKFNEDQKKEIRDKLKSFENLNYISRRTFDAIINQLSQARTRGQFNKLSEYIDKAMLEADNKEHNDVLSKIIDDANLSKYTKRRKSGIKKSTIPQDQRDYLETVANTLKRDNTDNLIQERDALIDQALSDPSLAAELAPKIAGLNTAIEALSGLEGSKRALKEVRESTTESRKELKETLYKKAKQYEEDANNAAEAVVGSKAIPDVYERKKALDAKKGIRGAFARLADAIGGFLDMQEGLRMLLDKIDQGDRKKGAFSGFLDKFYNMTADGLNTKLKSQQADIKIIQDKLLEIYGSKKKVRQATNNNNKAEKIGVYELSNGKTISLELSQNQAYHLYNMAKNAKLKETFFANGWTQQMLDDIQAFLTPEVKQWADWQVDVFYPQKHKQINEVYKRMNYMDLGKPENYAPVRRTKAKVEVAQDLGTFQAQYMSAEFGNISSRTNNTQMFDITADGDVILMQYTDKSNHYIGYAEVIKSLNAVFGNQNVRELITIKNNRETLTALDNLLLRIANDGNNHAARFGIVDKFRGWFTTSSLAIAPIITIKQLLSTPAYIADIGVRSFAAETARYMANPIKYAKIANRVFKDSAYLRDRYQSGFERDMQVAMARDYKQSMSGKSTLLDKLMFNVKWGDAGAIAMGMAVYSHHNRVAQKTMSKQDAHLHAVRMFEEATKLSQQSAGQADLSAFQAGGTFAKLFTMFLTTPIAYMRQERKAVRDMTQGVKNKDINQIKDGAKRFAIFHFVLPIMFQYVSNGLPGLLSDWDDEDADDLIRAGVLGNVNGLFIAGQALNYMADRITGKPWARKGTLSMTPAFNALGDFSYAVTEVVNEFIENPNALEEELIYQLSGQTVIEGADMFGLPAGRVQNVVKTIQGAEQKWDELDWRQKTKTFLGYSPYHIYGDSDKTKMPKELKKRLKKISDEEKRIIKDGDKAIKDYVDKKITGEELFKKSAELYPKNPDRLIDRLEKYEVEKNLPLEIKQVKSARGVKRRAEIFYYYFGNIDDPKNQKAVETLFNLGGVFTDDFFSEYQKILLEANKEN